MRKRDDGDGDVWAGEVSLDLKKKVTIFLFVLVILVPTLVILVNAYFGFTLYHRAVTGH
ncbi:hypothetical protein ACSYAY_09090 [Leptospirillum ferriphilum]|uniref:hypothetical protein n=1 Tax=Leptospirillum ferriphilum TaxID=178606 RepID=UPI003EE760D4